LTVWVTGLLIDVDTRLPFIGAAILMVGAAAWVAHSSREGA
jgi:hypothetical protein